jgi:hypothetical protein
MLNLCGIVTAILKMATGRNCSIFKMAASNANIQHCPISSKFDMWVDNDVPNWGIADIEQFLPVAIFKMAVTIPHKFNIVRFQRHFICG